MKHGPYQVVGLERQEDGERAADCKAWTVVDWRTNKNGQVWRTEREAEIDLARILLRNMMHG